MESQQWVADIAKEGWFPYVILEKIRGHRTARAMMETVKHLQNAGVKSVMCIGDALFTEDACSL
jgi:ribose-phosphate pyrophosphokinase